jgi:hypothetical protein
MSTFIDLFYYTLYSGCVMSWFILVLSLYGSFRHGANRASQVSSCRARSIGVGALVPAMAAANA